MIDGLQRSPAHDRRESPLGWAEGLCQRGAYRGAGALVSQVAREFRAATETMFAPLDLTTQQASLLLHASRGLTSPNDLAAVIGTDTAGATRLLDRLEAKGLLSRGPHPTDRRSVLIELTTSGTALVPRVPPVF